MRFIKTCIKKRIDKRRKKKKKVRGFIMAFKVGEEQHQKLLYLVKQESYQSNA